MSLKIEVGVIKVEGEEACKFLHAIVSSDVQSLQLGQSQPSLLLTPAGKVVSCFWILREQENTYLLVMEKEISTTTLESLSKFLIRTKAKIDDVSSQYFCDVAVSEESKGIDGLLIESNHLGKDGINLYLCQKAGEELTSGDEETYESLRISFGAVSCSKDLTAEIIPQEANLDKNAVSFTKGCYLGQELVCRIDSREASTPFSFYAIDNSLATTDGNVVVTSKLEPKESFENGIEQGPFTSIIRVPRKHTEDIEDAGAQPVSGYFSC